MDEQGDSIAGPPVQVHLAGRIARDHINAVETEHALATVQTMRHLVNLDQRVGLLRAQTGTADRWGRGLHPGHPRFPQNAFNS